MKSVSYCATNKYILSNTFMFLLLSAVTINNVSADGSLSYSPDQLPRHWNVLINKTQQQNKIFRQRGYSRQKPMRSRMWGVAPVAEQKSRRTRRPEYNTNAHMMNYSGRNMYGGYYTSAMNGYGLANPYDSPLMVPGLMPGLGAPGIPFMANSYGANPYGVGMPFPGYMW